MTPASPSSRTLELLAPAGSFAAFEAALAEGADAVYLGVPGLNARALSRDFSPAEIRTMVEHAHGKGVKVYLAMNSLIRENELAQAAELLATFAKIRPDALIIQDLGLFRLAHTCFPDLPLHASTLMCLHNSLGVARLAELGCKRVVLPRELTIEEIRAIHLKTAAELEVFVHGAMCFSYSGLCLFSSLHGGKSSLRGQCVQPCRRRYGWQLKGGRGGGGRTGRQEGGYLFSMNDLCGIDLLPQLQEAGVTSLKIEGRMKSAQYVRNTVRAYRLLLDSISSGAGLQPHLLREAGLLLDEAMGRRRSSGFFLDSRPQEAVSPHLTGNIGVVAGRVLRRETVRRGGQEGRTLLTVELRSDLEVGDRLRMHDEDSGERTAFTLRSMKLGPRFVRLARSGQKVTIIVDQLLPGGRRVSGRCSLFKVDVSSRRREEEAARSRFGGGRGGIPKPDQHLLAKALREIDGGDGDAGEERIGRVHRQGHSPEWWIRIGSLRDMRWRLPVQSAAYLLALTPTHVESWFQSGIRSRRSRERLVWCLPPVILEGELVWYEQTVVDLIREGCSEFQLGHWSQRFLFDDGLDAGNIRLYTHYTCNVLNSMAIRFLSRMGFAGVQFSIETDRENLIQALAGVLQEGGRQSFVGLTVFGHLPLFSARLEDRRYHFGKRFVSPKGESFVLQQGEGMTQARAVLPFSLLQWRKELESLGIAYFVVDLSSGNIKNTLAEFTALLRRRGEMPAVLDGNYLSGLV